MKVLVVIDQLEIGGAARVCSIIVQALSASYGYDIFLEASSKHAIRYTLPDSVRILDSSTVELRTKIGTFINVICRIIQHRRYIREINPDAIIAFLPGVFMEVWCANLGTGIPLIASDHTSMQRNCGRFNNFIRHNWYSKADVVTILTNKDRTFLGDRLKNKLVMYNPLTYEPKKIHQKEKEYVVLCAGRVDAWNVKGFDRMIEIWGKISTKFPAWQLKIAGDGKPETFQFLSGLCRKYNVETSIKFMGYVADMRRLYEISAIFALPSRVEGFPMVLIEGMSQSCACISFAMKGAVDEIIDDGSDGIVVHDDDINRFTGSLVALMSDINLREKIGLAASVSVNRFSVNEIAGQWNSLIESLVDKPKSL